MGADRRVDPAGPVEPGRTHHLVVERLAHAVQALELVPAGMELRARHADDGAHRLGVVGRELREHRVRCREKLPGTGQVGHVGMELAGEDREAVEPVGLGALDLRVPVGALDEPHHDAPPGAAGEVDDPVDHEGAPLAVGLDDEAEAVPAREPGVEAQGFEEIERDLQAIRLFGVDVEPDVVGAGQRRQSLEARQQLARHAVHLGAAVARVQGRQLDRDAGAVVDAAPIGGLADGVDRGLVIGEVAGRVLGRGGGLAQHVVGITEPPRLEPAAIRERFRNGLPSDELLAHHPHGEVGAAADQRLAAAPDEPRQRARQARFAGGRGQAPRHDEAPGRGIDEQRRAPPDMGAPVAVGDLVADQGVPRGIVRDAQQRLGEAHQGDALLARQRIFVDQPLDAAPPRLGAQRLDELAGGRGGLEGRLGRQGRRIEQGRHAILLGPAIGRRDGGAQGRLRLDRRREGREGLRADVGLIGRKNERHAGPIPEERGGSAAHRCI